MSIWWEMAGSCHGAPSEDRQGHSEGPDHDSDRVRKRHGIEEGSRLIVEDRGDSIVFRPVPRLEDLGGSLSKTTTLERMLKILDESREDED